MAKSKPKTEADSGAKKKAVRRSESVALPSAAKSPNSIVNCYSFYNNERA